ncbi:MAG: hypothetical protein RRZ24_09990 [Clostridia bacterium]
MKKIICGFLSTLLVMTMLIGCNSIVSAKESIHQATTDNTETQTHEEANQTTNSAENLATKYKNLEELLAANPNIRMSDAPAGATGVAYATIGLNGQIIAQIAFTFNNDAYLYHAAACEKEADAKDIADISESFQNNQQRLSERNLTNGGVFNLMYSDDDAKGLATWYYAPTACQYSLYTDTGCGSDQKIEEVVDRIMAVPGYDFEPGQMPAAKIAGTVTGIVASVDGNQIVINLANGNTLVFLMSYLQATQAVLGDEVKIGYSGDVTNHPEAMTIEVTKPAPTAIGGAIAQFDSTSVYVTISTGNVFGFVLDAKTKITGADNKLKNGDVVMVYYQGTLANLPKATEINIVTVAKDEKKIPMDKTLDGWVTKLGTKSFTIQCNNGKTWTFQKNATSKITGDYPFENACKVVVTYDGYASNSPVAKVITVIAPLDPTPPTPVYTTVSGTIVSIIDGYLSLTDGTGYYIMDADISGDLDAGVGDKATVTYCSNGGIFFVVRVVLESVGDSPVPRPLVEPAVEPEENAEES